MTTHCHVFSWFLSVLTLSLFCLLERPTGAGEPSARFVYPKTRRGDVVDTYHGVRVPDPYRWLEQDIRESKEVADWVAAQNQLTTEFLASIPERDAIRRRLAMLWNYPKYSAPVKVAGRYYYLKNDGLQNQNVLYVMDSLEAEPRALIDPNHWSADGTVALAGIAPSDEGKYLAYGRAEAGSDWTTWRVMDVATGETLPDEVRWTKFGKPSWTADGRGFFYGRYDEPKPGETFQQLNLNHKLFYHRIGASQADDVLVYQRPDHPDWSFIPAVTEDGRYLVVTVHRGTDQKYRILVRDLEEPYAMPVELVGDFDNEYTLVGNDGSVLFFKTDLDAPRGRVVAIDLRQPEREQWLTILPEDQATLADVNLVGNLFVAQYLLDVKSQVRVFTTDGRFVREVKLPAIGATSGFAGRRTDNETFYSFSSFTVPPTVYRYDLITGTSVLFRRAEVKFNPDDYAVEQVFYRSKDGTRVPMFLAYRKGVKLDGTNPTLLYGYGGFGVSMQPEFRVSRLLWMEMGGVFAVANLRGGGEYGEAWHEAGKKLKKQNVFDDFIAAAEWLVDKKYTKPSRLAVLGGSNGGLLVGAVMTQRPDLFGACLPAVGVMDMLRFQKFTAGRYWVDDYGSSDDPREFEALLAYSPYHNVTQGTKYPPTLAATADTDDRVVPGHSFKFMAALQAAQADDAAPVLLRIESRAGHGGATPTSKQIELTADLYAFLVEVFDMRLPEESFGKNNTPATHAAHATR
ncbi:MAG: S9 family peptidase [Pirellulales bacterium]|nr:S9 family peptidase [Pirellulales bacterium]